MKRYIFVVVLSLIFLFTGFQNAFSQPPAGQARGNAVSVGELPDELQNLDLKDYFIPSRAALTGSIRTVIGHVVVLHTDTNEAYFAAEGDQLYKNDVFFTLENSRCRVVFTTADVITMGANTKIGVEEFLDDHRMNKKKSIFNMFRGKAMFYAMSLFRYRTASTSVNTPTAVVGVRGTKFGLEVSRIGENLASASPVYIADASDRAFQYLAQTGAGDARGMQTTVRGYEGDVDTKSIVTGEEGVVGPNEKQTLDDTGARPLEYMDPDDARMFEDSVSAGEPVAEDKPKPTGEPILPPDTSAEDRANDAAADQSDLNVEGGPRPTIHQGYFAGILVCAVTGEPWDVVVSQSPQDFDSDYVAAQGVYSPYVFVEAQGGSPVYGDPYLGYIDLYEGGNSGDLGTSRPITWSELGYNAYQEWGRWNFIGDPVNVGPYYTVKIEGGYYLFGDPTPDAAVNSISGEYGGPAYGTYIDAAGAHDMTGGFYCQVNGLSGYLSDFNLAVISPDLQHGAAIDSASGSFSSSSFSISGGIWELLNGSNIFEALSTGASGSLYGPNGELIGGAWGMYGYNPGPSEYEGASGIFQGYKVPTSVTESP